MYRLPEQNVKFLPKIPAQPISYSEAQAILQWEILFSCFKFSDNHVVYRYIQGSEVEIAWRGSLDNVIYRYGDELRDSA
jgi:hypothetical protein